MKIVYYTVEREVDWIDEEVAELNGFKSINIYSIEDNIPKSMGVITDLELNINSKSAIQEYLNDNGYEDKKFEFVLL